MIKGENVILQAFLGTLLTWGLTALGAAMVYLFACGCCSAKQKILDFSLGFAAGVMIAASFWSLLSPGISAAEHAGYYGQRGEFAWGPVAIGFLLGGAFCLLSDQCIQRFSKKDPAIELAIQMNQNGTASKDKEAGYTNHVVTETSVQVVEASAKEDMKEKMDKYISWKRILLLLIAITVHNIPEGLAVGVAFGGLDSAGSVFAEARNLAIAIGIQNFPEGMAVSVPLCSAGYSPTKAFFYGQLSGVVEPIFGVLGALIIVVAEPLLPYALAFGAGAMIYVVVDNIIPEANMHGNGKLASWGTMVGFTVMMILDVGLAYI